MEIAEASLNHNLRQNSQRLFDEQKQRLCVRTDKLFGVLLFAQWIAGVIEAFCITPLTWAGDVSSLHLHVIFALVVGGALTLYPICLVLLKPGSLMTRHAIAVTQMLFSCLFIHLSGGRIETHFHIFGSLALLAFYRDWRVLVTASSVVLVDHFVRGWYFPQSIFGVNYASPWRAAEHVAWVAFEDIFLLFGISQSVREMHEIAANTAQLEGTNERIERAVTEKTKELKAGEIELQRLAAVVQQSGDSIVSMSMDGIIRSWNHGAERLYGYTAEEAIGQMYRPPLPEALLEEQRELLKKIKRGETVDGVETVNYRKDGTFVDVSITMSPVRGDDDTINAFSIVARDITQKKIAERRISEFYSVISHELRTPLTSIRGALALLADGIVEQGTPEADELIAIAQTSTSRLVRLINDILDLRKIEAGKFELNLEDISARDIVETSVSSMLGFAEEKKVQLHSDVESDFYVEADSDRINQVLCNLISNAVKYAPEGSTVEISATKNSHSMQFAVSDTGPGVPLEFQSKLFGKFQQVDASDTRAKEGSGLGLAISKAIVEQHGGTIAMTSEPNVKTVFEFDVPLANKHIFSSFAEPTEVDFVESQMETQQDTRTAQPLRLVPALKKVEVENQCGVTSVDSVPTAASGTFAAPFAATAASISAFATSLVGSFSAPKAASAPINTRAFSAPSSEFEGVTGHFFPAFAKDELNVKVQLWPSASQLGEIVEKQAEHHAGRAGKILIVEDDIELSSLLRINFERQNYYCMTAHNLEQARQMMESEMPDALVLDLELPDGDGLDLLSQLPGNGKPSGRTPVVVITGSDRSAKNSESSIVDWLQKPFNQGNLSDAVKKALTMGAKRKKVMVIDDDPDSKMAVTHQLAQLEVSFVETEDCLDIARFDEGPQLDLIVFKESCLQGSEASRAFRKLRGRWSDYVPIIIYSSSELTGQGQNTSSVSISHHMPKPTLEANFLSRVENVLFSFLSNAHVCASYSESEMSSPVIITRDAKKVE